MGCLFEQPNTLKNYSFKLIKYIEYIEYILLQHYRWKQGYVFGTLGVLPLQATLGHFTLRAKYC